MKKNILAMILSLVMVGSILPTAVFAGTDPNTSESEPVLLGTEAEYAGALNTIFDENGLLKVSVGFNTDKGSLNCKVGLINKYGNFVAAPIYDSIALQAADYDLVENGRSTVLPHYFIGGYTQAVRDGKMGLLNTNGEEVIPCQYDFVRLPSEGVCAVFDSKGRLGYWNLEQNREIVAPKYTPLSDKLTGIGRQKPTGDYICCHDFIQGYAMVAYPDETVNIIDKNGTEILGKNYPLPMELKNLLILSWERYPQKGPYFVYYEERDGSNIRIAWSKGEPKDKKLKYTLYYATGLVGAEGVLIPPSYTGAITTDPSGLKGNSLISTAYFYLIPEKNLILTDKNPNLDTLFEGAFGGIDLRGNTVIPFNFNETGLMNYNEKEGVVTVIDGRGMWATDGTQIHDLSYAHSAFCNGYDYVFKYSEQGVYAGNIIAEYFSKPDGTLFDVNEFLEKLGAPKMTVMPSKASTSGYFWIKGVGDKWGLIDFYGNIILPFDYDIVNFNSWYQSENGYALVTKNGKSGLVNAAGKLVADCIYDTVYYIGGTCFKVFLNNKVGLADLKKGGLVLPAIYDAVGKSRQTLYESVNIDCFAMGVYYAQKDGKYLMVDESGNTVFSSEDDFTEVGNGLYGSASVGGRIDNRGHLIFPDFLNKYENLEYGDSYTIYVENGNVYRLSANYIDHSYGFKPYAPQNVTASPSSTKLMVNGKSVAVDAYNINDNNYIKLRDLAQMVNGTDKNFEVTWNETKNAVDLVSGKPYTAVGGEMTIVNGQNQASTRTSSKIYVDGGEVSMTAYNINDNNYFKLRDVMQTFDIGVGWDAATETATLTTDESYALTDYEQAKYDAHVKAYEYASKHPYIEKPMLKEEAIRFISVPDVIEYNVGEPFDITGFRVDKMDIYADSTDITSEIVLKVENTKIYDGYKFKVAGTKTVNCYYNGEKLNSFKITVFEKTESAELPVADGNYYITLMGKYVVPVGADNSLELSDAKPAIPFTLTHLSVDKETGHHIYSISIDKKYVQIGDGSQLTANSSTAYKWRIAKYSNFWTVRQESNQAMAVNAQGASDKNGTPVIVYKHTGSAPENAKLQFVPAN